MIASNVILGVHQWKTVIHRSIDEAIDDKCNMTNGSDKQRAKSAARYEEI